MPTLRSFLTIPYALLACGLFAQSVDVFVEGTLTDAVTGAPITDAQVRITDQLVPGFSAAPRTGTSGRFLCELRSGWGHEGGRYILEFTGEGYTARTAMIDASEVKKMDLLTAWRITMDVALAPAGAEETLGAPLGNCSWHAGSSTLRWAEVRARTEFPIRQYREERLAAQGDGGAEVKPLPGLKVDGTVTDHWTNEPLPSVDVHVTTVPPDTTFDLRATTDRYGTYLIALPFGPTYDLDFGRPGLVHKRVRIDTRKASSDGLRAVLDIRLFAPLPDEDLAFLEEPIGRMTYNTGSKSMEWDMAYSRPLLDRLNAILERHKRGRGKGR